MKTYTELDVQRLLLAAIIFSGANDNQGLKAVKGDNYGAKAERLMEAFDNNKDIDISHIVIAINK